jgi:hypothetical protein
MRWIKIAIGAVVAISVIPTIVTSVAELTGAGMPLAGTVSGTLLDLAPLVFVASILAFLFMRTGTKD